MEWNYFAALCFAWAAVGLCAQAAILLMGSRWKSWELGVAYPEQKPWWVYAVALSGFSLVAFTWYQASASDVPDGWILALILSLTVIKLSAILFRYELFRRYVAYILGDRRIFLGIRIGMAVFCLLLVLLGCHYLSVAGRESGMAVPA